MARRLKSLNQQALRQYAPVVESILASNTRDPQHIERTLDGLLDFCGYPPALVLYRRLCRHYWDIDASATASYIYAYRDMWEPTEGEP